MAKKRIRSRSETSTEALAPTRRAAWVLPAGAFVLGLLAYAYGFDTKLYLGGDNVAYFLLGKALAGGHGYVNLWRAEPTLANHFPPGYPALIASAMTVGLTSSTAIKLLNGVLLFAALGLLYPLFVRFSGRRDLAAVAVAAAALNSHLLFFGSIMMSEVPFLFVTALVLFAAARLDDGRKPWADPWFWVLALGLVAGYYLRSIGLAVVFGVVVFFALRRRWLHGGLTLAVFALGALPWYLRGRSLGGNNYVGQLFMVNPYDPERGIVGLGGMAARLVENLVRYVSVEIPTAVVPVAEWWMVEAPVVGWIVGLALVGLIAFGLWRLKALRLLLAAYFVGTFGITLLWPEVWTGVRFILALIPLLAFLALYGLAEGVDVLRSRGRGGAKPLPALVLLPLVALLAWTPLRWLHARAEAPYPPQWRNYFSVAEWARANTPEGSVVAARKDEFFYFFSDRPTVRYLYSHDPAAVLADLEAKGADYVVVDQLGFAQTGRFLVPAVESAPARFPIAAVAERPETYLLGFLSVEEAALPVRPAPMVAPPPEEPAGAR